MEILIFVLAFMGTWAWSIGQNLSLIKNYNMGYTWQPIAVLGGPFTTLMLFAIVRNSDEMATKRKLTQIKTEKKLLEAKMEEEKTYTKYLGP